jgi:hypothetical protein
MMDQLVCHRFAPTASPSVLMTSAVGDVFFWYGTTTPAQGTVGLLLAQGTVGRPADQQTWIYHRIRTTSL